MADKHTPEPWKVHGGMLGHKGDIFVPTAKSIRDCHHVARCFAPQPSKQPVCELQIIQMEREAISTIEANARRIVACVNALSGISTEAIEAGGVQEVVEAAREARECLRLGAVVPLRDTANYDEVSALGNRIGFGALMATASLAWRDECGEMAGGEFVCGPCRSTSEKAIVKIDTALSKWEASK